MSDPELEYLKQFLLDQRLERLEEVVQQRTRHFTVVLENVNHDHNASACLRTADCLGIQDVHIIESLNHFRPKCDVALGASKWLTIHRYSTISKEQRESEQASCYASLRQQGFQILATSPRQNSIPLDQVQIQKPTAIVFGAEQVGVSEAAISEADGLIHIPMYGFTESFNISVSVALILRHLIEQVRAADISWQISEQEQQHLLLQWVRRSLGHKYPALKRRFDEESGT